MLNLTSTYFLLLWSQYELYFLLQIIAVLLATVAAVLSLKYLDNSLNNLHQRVGLALYGGIWLQALIGILRPHRYIFILKTQKLWICSGLLLFLIFMREFYQKVILDSRKNYFNETKYFQKIIQTQVEKQFLTIKSQVKRDLLGHVLQTKTLENVFEIEKKQFVCRERKGRNIWNIFHWLLGIGVSFHGVINIYTGLQAYHEKTSKSARIWTIIFIAQICLTIFLYLLQEKRYYIQNQGVILVVQPTDQELSPRNKQRETPPQNCRGLG